MQRILFILVCAICLIFGARADLVVPPSLTETHGTLYINGRDKDGNLPKGDCWEMKCPNGCVEEEGTFTGHCCPGGDSCRINGKDISECCGEGKTCKEGKCVINCPEPPTKSCLLEEDTVDTSTGCVTAQKIDCADTPQTPICDNRPTSSTKGQCIACLENTDCNGKKYCALSPETAVCQDCPNYLPGAGQACTTNCGCAEGLACIPNGQTLCGINNGICKKVCETDADCNGYGHCDPSTKTCIGCSPQIVCNEAELKHIRGRACIDDADCGGDGCGYYCYYEKYHNLNTDDPKSAMNCTGSMPDTCRFSGTCKPVGNPVASLSIGGKNLLVGPNEKVNWWSARNWCQSQCKDLVQGEILDCYKSGTHNRLGNTDYGLCCQSGVRCSSTGGLSDKMGALRNALSGRSIEALWRRDNRTGGAKMTIRPTEGQISYKHRNGNAFPGYVNTLDYRALCE